VALVETEPAPEPIYLSFANYFERTTYAKQMARCHAAAKKANRERLLSPLPKRPLVGADVWNLLRVSLPKNADPGVRVFISQEFSILTYENQKI
jgi:hypothetical protein